MAVTRNVITISSEEGSGGREIAQELAKNLKLTYVDSQIIKLATQKLGIPEAELAEFDEKVLPKVEDIRQLVTQKKSEVSLSSVLVPDRDAFGLVQDKPATTQVLTEEEEDKRKAVLRGYHALVERLIMEFARHGNVVIVGRGANFVLRDWSGVVNIHVEAPLPDRIDRYAYIHHVDRKTAKEHIARVDKQRADYVREYYEGEWTSPDNYHLVVNTSRLPLHTATAAICKFVKEAEHNYDLADPLSIHRSYDRLSLQDSYSVNEAAQLLLTDPDLLRLAVYRGELKATVIDHNVARISREALATWIRRYRQR